MADTWEALKQDCMACRGCALAETRTNVVFGDGARDAEILARTRMSRACPLWAVPDSFWTICWRSSIWTAPRSTSPTW